MCVQFCMSMTPGDDVTGTPPRMVMEWRLSLQSISSIAMSPYADNVYVIESHSAIPVVQRSAPARVPHRCLCATARAPTIPSPVVAGARRS